MKEIILNAIFLILNSSKSNEEISQIIGGIHPYIVMQYRRMMGLKKFAGKTAETMTESNLKEFYSLLQIERDMLKKCRYLVKLLLTTNKINKEILEVVDLPLILVIKTREKLMCRQCDWQKIKAMSDHEFKKLLRTRCPRFTEKYLPSINYIKKHAPQNQVMLHEVWKEYRQASLQ